MSCLLCQSKNITKVFEKQDPHLGVRSYWECSECGLIFVPPSQHLNEAQEKSRYDTHQNDPKDERYVKFLERLTRPLLSKLKPEDCGLDFGCGPGPTVYHILAQKGYKVDNYDPFYFPDDKLLQRQYDFVTCTEVVEHFCQPNESFQIIDRLLKPSGSILGLMTQMIPEKVDFADWWYHRDPTHVCFYPKKAFEWMAQWMSWRLEFLGENIVFYAK